MIPVPKLLSQIQTEHVGAITAATQAVRHVLNCGRLLISLKSSLPGEWEAKLESISMPKTTAWRYMKVASDAAKNPAKVKYLLEQGASLVDLYRAFDLVKPVVSGAYSSDVYKARRGAEDTAQLELFNYEKEFVPAIRSLIKSRDVEELKPETLRIIKRDLVTAQKRVDDLIANYGAAAMEIVTEEHQP
jgi:hypothetical protein